MSPSPLLCKPPPSTSPPQLASNHTCLPGRSPSPPLRDVGLITNATSKRRSLDPGHIRPSSLQRMWAAPSRLTEELGMKKCEGGPKKWEAHSVRYRLSSHPH
jgi:hypothetical protein